MSLNIGTLITSPIRPNDSLDLIASAFANEIKGGHHGYASLSERNSLIVERREWGMLVTVYNDGVNNGTYQLTYNYVDTNINNNSNWVVFAGGGGGGGTIEWVDSVFSRLGSDPGSPSVGDRYLIFSSAEFPSGTWATYPDHIAEWISSATWSYTIPRNGLSTRVDNQDNSIFRYEGSWPTGTWIKELVSQVRFVTAISSTGVTYSASPSPTFSYSTEMLYLTTFGMTNSASASLNINGMGVIPIKKTTNVGLSDVISGDLIPNVIYNMTYDGSNFQVSVPTNGYINGGTGINVIASGGIATVSISNTGVLAGYYGSSSSINTFTVNAQGQLTTVGTQSISITSSQVSNFTSSVISTALASANFVDSTTVDFLANGATVSAVVVNGSLTASHLNTGGAGATAGYVLSVGVNGVFNWITPPTGGITSSYVDSNTIGFTFSGTTVSAYVIQGSLTASHLNTVTGMGPTAGYILSVDGSGVFKWVPGSGTGTITGVTAGVGLTGGGISGDITLDINTINGLSIISDSVGLGGTLSQNTILDTNSNNLDFIGTSGYMNFETGVSGLTSILQITTASAMIKGGSPAGATKLTVYNANQSIGDGSSNNRMIIYDDNFKGVVYADDYTANFTTYSLVTKGYVVSQKSVMSINDKNLVAIATIGDGEFSGATISGTPIDGCYVSVFVNGLEFIVGNGVTNSVDCYFSNNGGASARGFFYSHPNGKVQANDMLYWNSVVSGTSLVNGWRISLHYLI